MKIRPTREQMRSGPYLFIVLPGRYMWLTMVIPVPGTPALATELVGVVVRKLRLVTRLGINPRRPKLWRLPETNRSKAEIEIRP